MAELENHEKDARVARANRLRAEIEALKRGRTTEDPNRVRSLKEQIKEAERRDHPPQK